METKTIETATEMDAFTNVSSCPSNLTVHDLWLDHRLWYCFLDSMSSSILAAFIVIFGSVQLLIFRNLEPPEEVV